MSYAFGNQPNLLLNAGGEPAAHAHLKRPPHRLCFAYVGPLYLCIAACAFFVALNHCISSTYLPVPRYLLTEYSLLKND